MSAMAASSIEELLDLLYTEIEEAKNATFSADRCIIERDKILDMIDDVKAELPVELKRAKDLVANKNDYIASAKREADAMRKKVEEEAKRFISKEAIVRQAEARAEEIIAEAEDRSRTLQHAANEYCEDTLRRMEEAVAEAYDEVKRSRSRFRSALTGAERSERPQSGRRPMYDAEADE